MAGLAGSLPRSLAHPPAEGAGPGRARRAAPSPHPQEGRKEATSSGETWHKSGEKILKYQQGGAENVKMPSGIAFSTFGLLLGLYSPVLGQATDTISVNIFGSNVTLSCPIENASWWKKKGDSLEMLAKRSSSQTTANSLVTQHNGMYLCGTDEKGGKSSIYLQVKECPGCVEMDIWVVTGIVVADLLVTLGVLILAYFWGQKRAARFSAGPPAGGLRRRPRGQKEEGRPPPVPNPDYEPIRKGQRGVYAGLQPRAF